MLFSSVTVAAAVAALAIFPQRFLYSMGIAGAIVALLAATLALTVLPALLAVLGPRVNALSPRRLRRAAERDARPARSGAWYRLAQFVTRRPVQVAVASAAVLIALAIPFAQVRFITADAGVLPASASAHQVQDALEPAIPAQPHHASRGGCRRPRVLTRKFGRSPSGSPACRMYRRSRPRSRPGAGHRCSRSRRYAVR